MITNVAKYDSTGKYVWFGSANDPIVTKGQYIGHVNISNQYHDVLTDTPTNMPSKPGDSYVFNYATKTWESDSSMAWHLLRQKRARLLSETDWVITKALESGQAVSGAWLTYRQALRDITEQPDPMNIVWPQLPG